MRLPAIPFDLKSFLEGFHRSNVASIITNGHGFILEANEAAALIFKTVIEALKNKSIVSFAHRKSTKDINGLLVLAKSEGIFKITKTNLRPRNSLPFRANITGKVICQSNMIMLIEWQIVDADLAYSTDEADKAAE